MELPLVDCAGRCGVGSHWWSEPTRLPALVSKLPDGPKAIVKSLDALSPVLFVELYRRSSLTRVANLAKSLLLGTSSSCSLTKLWFAELCSERRSDNAMYFVAVASIFLSHIGTCILSPFFLVLHVPTYSSSDNAMYFVDEASLLLPHKGKSAPFPFSVLLPAFAMTDSSERSGSPGRKEVHMPFSASCVPSFSFLGPCCRKIASVLKLALLSSCELEERQSERTSSYTPAEYAAAVAAPVQQTPLVFVVKLNILPSSPSSSPSNSLASIRSPSSSKYFDDLLEDPFASIVF
mmetsp:Transcript_31781/g.64692  ORF Transcript_31781/g.64692 Transcript_31781/m.64692 type:complete len:292 (-) Transcript_31781:113-988(-)